MVPLEAQVSTSHCWDSGFAMTKESWKLGPMPHGPRGLMRQLQGVPPRGILSQGPWKAAHRDLTVTSLSWRGCVGWPRCCCGDSLCPPEGATARCCSAGLSSVNSSAF